MNVHPDHYEDHMATGLEALREYAHNAGGDNPETPWLLTDWDVWVKNPYYTGPEVPHPELDMHSEPDTMKPDMTNPNSQLDPQDESHRLAHITSDEIHCVGAPHSGDITTGPNADSAYDGWGGCFPGDGSGMDDFADFNAMEGSDW